MQWHNCEYTDLKRPYLNTVAGLLKGNIVTMPKMTCLKVFNLIKSA